MNSLQKMTLAGSALGLLLAIPGLSFAGAGVHVSNIIIHPDPPYTTPPLVGGGGFSYFPIGGSSSETIDGDTITVQVTTSQIIISVTPQFAWQTQVGTDPNIIGGLDLVFADFPAITSVTKDNSSTAPVTQADVAAVAPNEVQFNFAGETWIDTGNPNTTSNVGIFDYMTQGPPIPEPATWIMMLVGFAGIGAAIRRRAKVVAGSLV